MVPFENRYTHRKVAETAAKACDICYCSSSSVLVATENKDFFYICPSHLKDRNFCTPIIDQAAIDARKKTEMEEEMARVKKDYEEKQKKKKEIEKEKKDKKDNKEDQDKGKDKDKDKDKNKDDKKDEDSKANDETKTDEEEPPKEEEPRIFALRQNFYQQRLNKKQQAEIARRNRERLQQADFFPSVPTGFGGARRG